MRRLFLAAVVARPLYVLTVKTMLRRNVAALMAGDPGPLVKMYADHAVLEFPGEHSWGPEYRGRAEIEGFLRRFLDAGLRGEIADVFVAGPPWATRIAVLFDDWAYDAGGVDKVYENRSVIVLTTRFGKVVRERVYEDTQKVAAFDATLAERAAPPVLA